MTLNEILDEVRFASGDICICVEDDVISLDKYYEGKYFHIDSNWDRGSNSWATPDIPEELMEHEVLQVWNLTNLEEVYGRINELQVSGMQNRVVIFVEEGYDFGSIWKRNMDALMKRASIQLKHPLTMIWRLFFGQMPKRTTYLTRK